ncbi:MAG: DUF92 domain-containing protein [Thermoproteus sp.]
MPTFYASLGSICGCAVWTASLASATGFAGDILDSVLGAVAQKKYICNGAIYDEPRCQNYETFGYLTNEAVEYFCPFKWIYTMRYWGLWT